MSATGYTEDALVEQPAIALLAELGWQTYNAYNVFDHGLSPLDWESRAKVVLKLRLCLALLRLSPDVAVESMSQVIGALSRDQHLLRIDYGEMNFWHRTLQSQRRPLHEGH